MGEAPQNVESQQSTIVCIGCARSMPADADFCPHCGAPVGPYCWWDPWKRIFAGGYVVRRLTGGPISRFVAAVLLLWLVLNLGAMVYMGYEATHGSLPEGIRSLPQIIGLLLVIAVLLAFMRRLLLNYGRQHRKEEAP